MIALQEIKRAAIDATANHGNAAGGFMGAVGSFDGFITGHYSMLMFFMAVLSVFSAWMTNRNKLKLEREIFEHNKSQSKINDIYP